MAPKIYSLSELALAAGRFEMQPTPHQGVLHRESLVGVDEAERFGLFEASEIRACQPPTRSARHQQLLDALGKRSGSHWILDAPQGDAARSKWARLLRSDQVLMFTAPSETWLSNIVRQ